MEEVDVVVVGAGLVGLATARALADRGERVLVLERADRVAAGQSSHNSGVLHAGIYYAPGSLKARLCVDGARRLEALCEREGVALRHCGKLVVARTDAERPRLDELERRARANGVPGLRRLDGPDALREVEPHVTGVAGLHSPRTGVVDYPGVAAALARGLGADGHEVRLGCAARRLERRGGEVVVHHTGGAQAARRVVVCAGLGTDALAEDPDPRVVAFRGGYLDLDARAEPLVRGMVYPVPDPRLPFLGVHVTKGVDGHVHLGPSALPVPGAAAARWPGTWRVLRRFWRTGVRELRLAASAAAFVREARGYVPGLHPAMVTGGWAGVRAQAVGRDGALLDDFALEQRPGVTVVRNAPSPAATACLAIGDHIAALN